MNIHFRKRNRRILIRLHDNHASAVKYDVIVAISLRHGKEFWSATTIHEVSWTGNMAKDRNDLSLFWRRRNIVDDTNEKSALQEKAEARRFGAQ